MSVSREVKPSASAPETQPDIKLLLPSFDFVNDRNLRTCLLQRRQSLVKNFEGQSWPDVAISCRIILESLLVDLLSELQPEKRTAIRHKELHFLLVEFSRIALPSSDAKPPAPLKQVLPISVAQGRFVQVLGNIAVHALKRRFNWDEQRATRLLYVTAVLANVIRRLYPGTPEVKQEHFNIRPDISVAAIAREIAVIPETYALYRKALHTLNPSKIGPITRAQIVVEAMLLHIGEMNTVVLTQWLSALAREDPGTFKRFAVSEADHIAAALLKTDTLRDVLIYVECLRRSKRKHILSENEYENILRPILRHEEILILKAATSKWSTIQRLANYLRDHKTLARRLRWLLAISPSPLQEVIEKGDYIEAAFLLRDWGRDLELRNISLGYRVYKSRKFLFEGVIRALAAKVFERNITLGKLTDIVKQFPNRLQIFFIEYVKGQALQRLLDVSECLDLAEFALAWRSEVYLENGTAVSSYTFELLRKKVAAAEFQQLAKLPWQIQWSRNTSVRLGILNILASKEITSVAPETLCGAVHLAWNIFQTCPGLQNQVQGMLDRVLKLWVVQANDVNASIPMLQIVGCLRLMSINTVAAAVKSKVSYSELSAYFSASEWDRWRVFLTAYGLLALDPRAAETDWFPRDRLISLIAETESRTEMSKKLLHELEAALVDSSEFQDSGPPRICA
jgi:hypothetical protein